MAAAADGGVVHHHAAGAAGLHMAAMQSQQAWIISQHLLSPLVQVMQTPSSVISHLHMPIVRLQQQTIMPFIIMQQLHMPPAIIVQRFCIMLHAICVVAHAGDLHAARCTSPSSSCSAAPSDNLLLGAIAVGVAHRRRAHARHAHARHPHPCPFHHHRAGHS